MALANDRSSSLSLGVPVCACGLLHWGKSWQEQPERKTQTIWAALGLLSCLFVVEVFMSSWSHSLSLLADSGHMLADIAVLGLTLVAACLSQRPATDRATFGYGRVEILVALLNGLSLIAVALFVAIEVVDRLQMSSNVLGLPMLAGATLGLGINSLNVWLLYQRSRDDLNMKSAFLHVAVDAASSVGLVFASLVIHFLHWMWIDAAISLVIAGLTIVAAIPLIKDSLEVLLEFSPRSHDPEQIKAAIATFEGVEHVEQLRLWRITSNQVMLSAQIQVAFTLDVRQRDRLTQQLQQHLKQEFEIQEATLQLERRSPANIVHPLLHRSLTDYVLRNT